MSDGYERLGRRASGFAERQAGNLADKPGRTAAKWIAGLVVVILLLGAIGGITGLIGDWFGEGKRIVSPTNVREQHTAIIGNWEAMEAAASNACAAAESPSQATDPSLLERPQFAYEAQYKRIRAEYNRRQKNLFEGKLVGPKGYPRSAPTLEEMQARVC